jgi:nitric-oxide synthase
MRRKEAWELLDASHSESLKKTVLKTIAGLFESSNRDQINRLLDSLQLRRYSRGAVLCSEGETAKELYVLCSGCCGVYTQEADGQLRLLEAVHQTGALLGEQVFRQDRRFRNATILTLEECHIGALSGELFRELLNKDPSANQTLGVLASQYARNKLVALAEEIEVARLLQPNDPSNIRQIPSGTPLFSIGEPASCAYFLLAGSVSLFRAGATFSHETIRAGFILGANDVMAGTPRSETAVSASDIEVLEIDAEQLKGYADRKGPAGTILTVLESAHELPEFGTVYRSIAQVDGESCLISDYRLLNGSRVRVRMFPKKSHLEVANQSAVNQANTLVSYDGKTVLLVSPNDELVGLRSPSDWNDLGNAMSLILRNGKLNELQKRAFTSTGQILVEAPSLRTSSNADVICACINATCSTLSQAAKRAQTIDDLTKITGAGGVCGGCKGRLSLFFGKQDVYLCRLKKAPLAHGSFKAFLQLLDHTQLPPAKVGQFIRIEALIDGTWIGRPYTLTNSHEHQYEIGVKIEEGGFFSNWLVDAPDGTLLRVFSPEGEVCPSPASNLPLVYVVAGIGVTPAIAATRRLVDLRTMTILVGYRNEHSAAYLHELRDLAKNHKIQLEEFCSEHSKRITPDLLRKKISLIGPCEVILCGPGDFNQSCGNALQGLDQVRVHYDSFLHAQRGQGSGNAPGSWRRKNFTPKCPLENHVLVSTKLPPREQAIAFLKEFHTEYPHFGNLNERIEIATQQLHEDDAWQKTPEELGFAAKLAWRNASQCVGRLYWKGLHLRDCRNLNTLDEIAQALFDHLRFAWNGGDLRPAISIFPPNTRTRPGPRIWNPQLLRYAGFRLRSGKQIGDPAQNTLTQKIIELGWEPQGTHFDLLPLVLQFPDSPPKLYEIPLDCQREVPINHPQHPWLARRGIKWYAVPAVSDMALDAAGMLYQFAPFNGWYLDCEIAARNLTDTNRYNLLPEIAEAMGLDISNDRTLWRDKAMLMLHEAVLHSFDQSSIKMADHHNVCHEFIEFCRNEHNAGREPYGKWMWLVPPFSSSATTLYQEPFRDVAIKPAYRYQKAIWEPISKH